MRIVMRDLSHTGHELGGAVLRDVPDGATLGNLLDLRIRSDVARYNAAPKEVFEGLVQPADSIRHSDGHRMHNPRRLDVEGFVAAGREAVAAGILWFVIGEETVTDLDRRIGATAPAGDPMELVAVLRRPIIARDS